MKKYEGKLSNGDNVDITIVSTPKTKLVWKLIISKKTYSWDGAKSMFESYKDKLIKVSIHEIGHTLNIPHCNSNKCIMNDAKGKGSNVDKELLDMCNLCKSKIRY
jgi:predicted Zn-dependent protease